VVNFISEKVHYGDPEYIEDAHHRFHRDNTAAHPAASPLSRLEKSSEKDKVEEFVRRKGIWGNLGRFMK
jgi:hypothetical protein